MNMLYSAAAAVYRRIAAHPRWLCRLKMLQEHAVEKDDRFWKLYITTLQEGAVVQPLEDFFNLYQLVLTARKLPGDIAELGVFRGGSAKLIASLKGDKALLLFDTFEGMPKARADLDRYKAG